MAYVGTPIDTQNQFQSLVGKRFNGDGSTTNFTLDVAPSSTLDIEVFVENVRQDPNSAYTLSGTTLSFTGAPPSGTNNIYVVHQAKAVGTINPPDASVNSDKLTGNLVTPGTLDVNGQELILDADADTSITADTDDQIDFKVAGNDRVSLNNTDMTLQTCALRINNSTTGTSSSDGLLLEVSGSEVFFNQKENADIHFRTNNTDRVTIAGGGDVLVGTTSGTINASNFGHKLENGGTLRTSANSGSGATVAEHFGNAGQFRVMGDGDAENTNNNYGALSDRTLKENETSANSQWDDIKALQIKNYNLIEYPDRPHLGVIAQDLESAGMTGLVKTDSEGLKSVKYSVLYMKAVKALQEAMTKIEDLESRVKTLEG